MQNSIYIDKFKASGLHLLFSLILALASLSVVYFIWYPQPLATATGVNSIFLMMLGIDVLLGPILTFLVFRKGKKTLKFDLSIIIILQLIAFSYGLYSISQARPAWIVYTVDRFELVQNNQILQENINQTKKEYQKAPWFGYKWVAVEKSKDIEELKTNILQESVSGISLSQHPEKYIALNDVLGVLKNKANHLSTLKNFNNDDDVDNILKKYSQSYSWLPLKANNQDMVVLLDKDAQVIKIVDLRPWK